MTHKRELAAALAAPHPPRIARRSNPTAQKCINGGAPQSGGALGRASGMANASVRRGLLCRVARASELVSGSRLGQTLVACVTEANRLPQLDLPVRAQNCAAPRLDASVDHIIALNPTLPQNACGVQRSHIQTGARAARQMKGRHALCRWVAASPPQANPGAASHTLNQFTLKPHRQRGTTRGRQLRGSWDTQTPSNTGSSSLQEPPTPVANHPARLYRVRRVRGEESRARGPLVKSPKLGAQAPRAAAAAPPLPRLASCQAVVCAAHYKPSFLASTAWQLLGQYERRSLAVYAHCIQTTMLWPTGNALGRPGAPWTMNLSPDIAPGPGAPRRGPPSSGPSCGSQRVRYGRVMPPCVGIPSARQKRR